MPIARLPISSFAAALLFAGASAVTAADGVPAPYRTPAEVTVTTAVAAPDPGAWTATFENPPIENLLSGGEYEPFNFRSRLYAGGDGVDQIPLSQEVATGYDCRREGFFNGATARVYRIVNGTLVNVRKDTVARHRASGWISTLDGKLVPPDQRSFQWHFDGYNAPDAPYYFAVVAVAEDGTWSKPSNAVTLKRPERCEAKASNEGLKEFKAPAAAAPGKAPESPAKFTVATNPDGVSTFTWDAVATPGLAGYLVLRSDNAADKHLGYGLDLAGKATTPEQRIRKGDLVFLDLRRTDWSRKIYTANRVWGDWENGGVSNFFPGHQDESDNQRWTLVPHPAPIPAGFTAADRGQTCVQITMTGSQPVELKQYNHAGPGQNWYPVLTVGRPYVVEFWARAQGMANPTVHFGFSSVYADRLKHDVAITGEWAKHVFEFTPDKEWPIDNQIIGEMKLSFTGPGTMWLDCWRIYPKDKGYMGVPKADIDDLRASGMSFLRTHAFIKSGWSYFLDDLTNAAGVVGNRGNANGAPPSTLFSILGFLKQAQVNPWLQIEMSLAEDEWMGLVEYLAAPFDPAKDTAASKPWAAKRFAMGQAKPWTDEFPKILFEVSNETWNPHPGFAPWHFPWQSMTDAATGRVYTGGELSGLMTGYILAQMKKSPHWNALKAKMETVGGGWLIQLDDNGFGQAMVRMCPEITHNLVANYNGGWDEGAGAAKADDSGRRLALTVCPQYIHGENAKFAATRDRLAAQGVKFAIGTYEAGPGYALPNTITPQQVEAESQVMKSLAAGTGTLDCFLDGARQGMVLQNFFTYSRGRDFWTSHALPRNGGQAYPSWLALTLYNRFATGDILVTQDISVPTDRLAATRTRPEAEAASLAGVYATRKGDRVSVFVLSRKLDNFPYAGDDGFTPVTLRLPFTAAKTITRHVLAGDPRAHNLDRAEITVQTSELPATAFAQSFALDATRGTDARGLPPAAVFLYVFTGVTFPAASKDATVRIVPAPGQATETTSPEVRFRVLFDRKVPEFAADQLTITAPVGAKAQIAWPTDLARTGCEVTIGGFEAAGPVGFTVPATIARSPDGKPAQSPVVQYRIPAPTQQVLAGDGFDYADEAALWSAPAGGGWAGPWTLNSKEHAQHPGGYVPTADAPLVYPGLLATPGHLSAGAQYLLAWRAFDVDGALAAFRLRGTEPAQLGLPGRSLWLSVVLRKDKDDGEPVTVSLNAEAFYKDELAFARFGWNGQKDGERRVWSLQIRTPDNADWLSLPTAVPVEVGKPALLVLEARFAATPVVNLYVNPPLGAVAPAKPSATATITGTQVRTFRNLVLASGTPGSAAYDEIRVSDGFAGVTPAAH